MLNVKIKKTVALAIPTMKSKDWNFIQSLRKQYDTNGYTLLEPHFTIFSRNTLFSAKIHQHLKQILKNQKKFTCNLRSALFMPPLHEHTSWYTFLIPDEGFSKFCHLHHRIDSAMAKNILTKKFPFIPHMTVGSFNKKSSCIKLVNHINQQNINLLVHIKKIHLIEITNNVAQIAEEIQLG